MKQGRNSYRSYRSDQLRYQGTLNSFDRALLT